MGVFLEHFAKNENGRKCPKAVTSYYSSTPRHPLQGTRANGTLGRPCPQTGIADWRGGEQTYLPPSSVLGSSVPHPVRGLVGNIFHRHKHHPLGFLAVEIISFLMRAPLWRKQPRMELSQSHLLLGAGPSSRSRCGRPAPLSETLRAPPGKPGCVWAVAQRK